MKWSEPGMGSFILGHVCPLKTDLKAPKITAKMSCWIHSQKAENNLRKTIDNSPKPVENP